MKVAMAINREELVPGFPPPKTFGEVLDQALEHKRREADGAKEFGITVGTKVWLAKAIGLKSSGVISHWAQGRHMPREDFMRKICIALDLNYDKVSRLPSGDLPRQAVQARPEIVEKGGKVFMIRAGRTYILSTDKRRWDEIEIEG